MVRLEGYDAAQALPAVGRPAPARRARPGARQPTAGAAPRRAARRARPEAPRGDADRAQGDPAAGRHHVHLRDARPGRGAHDERPTGRVQQRPDRAARRPADVYERPATQVRGRVRRDVEPADRRRRPTRSSGAPGPSRSGPRRSGSPSRTPLPAPDETSAPGHIRQRRLSRPRYALHRRARRRGRLVVTQQNLATTSTEALAQQGKAVRLIWKRQHELPVARWRQRPRRLRRGGGGA